MMTFDTRKYCLENKIASFSLKLTWDDTNNKKLLEPISWSKITIDNFKTYHDTKKTGFAILTGLNNIIVLDCDIAKANGDFPEDILTVLESSCKSVVKTPNGKHYYFKTTKSIHKQTGAFWKGQKVPTFDILADKSVILAPPSHYSKGDQLCVYQWQKGDLSSLVELPESIFEAIKKPQTLETNIRRSLPIESILEGISLAHYDTYDDWVKIGLILYNEGYSCELWDLYSKRSTLYQAGACEKKWPSFKTSPSEKISIATLYFWLKEENFSLFQQLQDNLELKYTQASFSHHKSAAQLFYNEKKDKYKHNNVYGWIVLQENNTYRNFENTPDCFLTEISDSLEKIVEDAMEHWKIKLNAILDDKDKDDDEDEDTTKLKKLLSQKWKGCWAHKKKLASTNYVKQIIPWLEDYFNDKKMIELLDSNRNLLAFEDKVWDFELCEFRSIRKEDYILTTTGYNAPSLDTPLHPLLETFLNSLFEDEQTLLGLLTVAAYTLWGNNMYQLFIILKGNGGNGKGLFISLLRFILGKYSYDLPVTYFTSKTEGKGAALPELAKCSSSRLVISSEPEDCEKIQIGFLKRISGGDPLTVRKLYCSEFSYVPQFTSWLLMNDTKLSKAQEAVQRRLRVFNFPFDFKSEEHYVPTNPKHRLADYDIPTFLSSSCCRDSFMTLLLRTFRDHVKGKSHLKTPPAVNVATKDYLAENNPLAVWLYDAFDTEADDKDRITTTELVSYYKQDTNLSLTPKTFHQYMSLLGFVLKKSNGKDSFRNIKRKIIDLEII